MKLNFYGDQTATSFPLYLYPRRNCGGELFDKQIPKVKRISNFAPEFLQAIKASLGTEPTPEEIFFISMLSFILPLTASAIEEFLKIDFPRVPLPLKLWKCFKDLSGLGKELVDLHLLKHPDLEKIEVGFPKKRLEQG